MKQKRFTDEQIACALRQAETGVPVKEVCRKLQVSEQTFYRWKKKFGGLGVAEVLDRIGRVRGLPERIRVDNGTEFTSKHLDQWAYLNGVTLEFSRRGNPTDNGLIEAFNGRLRAECLNVNWFLSLDDARLKIESWRRHYNGERLHSALGNLAPREFAASTSQVVVAG
jgi:putative transposase